MNRINATENEEVEEVPDVDESNGNSEGKLHSVSVLHSMHHSLTKLHS